MTFSTYYAHTDPLFKDLNILTIGKLVDIYFLYRIFTVHRLSFCNILFNIFSIYNVIMSIANFTSIPNDSSINPITILYT